MTPKKDRIILNKFLLNIFGLYHSRGINNKISMLEY